jgi:hypothetical protein
MVGHKTLGCFSMIEMLKKIKFSDWVSVAALVLATFVSVRDCSQNKRIEDLDYNSKAMEYRPRLDIVGNPQITSVGIAGEKKIATRDLLDTSQNSDTFIDIPCSLTVDTKLCIVNSGNSLAEVYAYTWEDTLSGNAQLRYRLLNKKLRENGFVLSPTTDYFTIQDIKPGDTSYFKLSHKANFVKENSFTMHFLLLYKNEVGVLYDTYYWARYDVTPIMSKLEVLAINNKPVAVRSVPQEIKLLEFLKLRDHNTSWRKYSKAEAEDIIRFFKRHTK